MARNNKMDEWPVGIVISEFQKFKRACNFGAMPFTVPTKKHVWWYVNIGEKYRQQLTHKDRNSGRSSTTLHCGVA
jgi:hypothetical protein